MQFTRLARAYLKTLPDDRRAVVGNRAKRIAYARCKQWAGMEEITAATLCADDAFIDTPDNLSKEGDCT